MIEESLYTRTQIERLVTYLIRVEDSLNRATDALQAPTQEAVQVCYVESQVKKGLEALGRAVNILREDRLVDILISAHNLAVKVLGGERM